MKSRRKLAEHLVANKGSCLGMKCSECFFDSSCEVWGTDDVHAWAVGWLALNPVVRRYKTLAELVKEYPDAKFNHNGYLQLTDTLGICTSEELQLLGKPIPKDFQPPESLTTSDKEE
jgi:hypothetical protein